MSTVEGLLWTCLAFASGALPFSVWVSRWTLGIDIRAIGDGNPGAANVWRASKGERQSSRGVAWAAVAVALDFLKGAVPVSLARWQGGLSMDSIWLALVAIAPVAGHAFSPLLNFRGGKALAVTFGVWAALTSWQIPIALGGSFAVWLTLLGPEGWAVLFGMLSIQLILLVAGVSPALFLASASIALIVVWKHRQQLSQPPVFRHWLVALPQPVRDRDKQ